MSVFVFACLVLSGIPKPDLISADIATIQSGIGLVKGRYLYDETGVLFPDLGLSLGQIRCYWGKPLAFTASLEFLRFAGAAGVFNFFSTCEMFTVEAGASAFLGYPEELNLGTSADSFESNKFIPRLDLGCGISLINPLNPTLTGDLKDVSPTVRLQAKLFLTRYVQISFEDRFIWGKWEFNDEWSVINSMHLSLCYALGSDFAFQDGKWVKKAYDITRPVVPSSADSSTSPQRPLNKASLPDLISANIIGVNVGFGMNTGHKIPFGAFYLGRLDWFWGNRIAFTLGCEMFKLGTTSNFGLVSLEALFPHIGMAWLGKPLSSLRSSCKGEPAFRFNEFYTPRLELCAGITTGLFWCSELPGGPYDPVISPVLKTELRAVVTPSFSIQLEYRWPALLPISGNHLFEFSLLFPLGWDNVKKGVEH